MRSVRTQPEWNEWDRVTWVDHDSIQRAGYVVADLSVQLLVRDDTSPTAPERFVFKNEPTLRRVK